MEKIDNFGKDYILEKFFGKIVYMMLNLLYKVLYIFWSLVYYGYEIKLNYILY